MTDNVQPPYITHAVAEPDCTLGYGCSADEAVADAAAGLLSMHSDADCSVDEVWEQIMDPDNPMFLIDSSHTDFSDTVSWMPNIVHDGTGFVSLYSPEPDNPEPYQIRAWRLSHGLTQAQCASLLYVRERQWQRWEHGETRMLRAVFECARYRLGELPSPYGDCWVVVCPKGLYYTGLHRDEADVWRVALGWPSVDEINDHKALGWYAVTANVTWQNPNLGE